MTIKGEDISQELIENDNFNDIDFLDFARLLNEAGLNVFKPFEQSLPLELTEKLFKDFNYNNHQKSLINDEFVEYARLQILMLNGYNVDPDGICRIDGTIPNVEYELYKNWT